MYSCLFFSCKFVFINALLSISCCRIIALHFKYFFSLILGWFHQGISVYHSVFVLCRWRQHFSISYMFRKWTCPCVRQSRTFSSRKIFSLCEFWVSCWYDFHFEMFFTYANNKMFCCCDKNSVPNDYVLSLEHGQQKKWKQEVFYIYFHFHFYPKYCTCLFGSIRKLFVANIFFLSSASGEFFFFFFLFSSVFSSVCIE